MDISKLNWAAIIVATLSGFIIGGLWYSKILFGATWMRETGITEEQAKQGNKGKLFGLAFLWTLVMAFNLAMFLNDAKTTASWGATAGFLAGFGWVAMGLFITGLFEKRSTAYMLINAGYLTVALTVMGLIIGAWR
ncbi:hypothetical protein BEL04_17840 [Mucilaginibacter sp. PPCGB 2223]|uniref:DUF1761 domain-containing protein n=1 Tax=Mucilaginibacter sp. PPCGB 2223 TaxID=1886027 RepID=UPI0008241485|nr:DUF1761 domain-containing protein [Mucilaginibacter sp. PPCGB 2223]OCX51996.1 hypothetical protein BEL04_17840 [Mucilaginibacter sp. PPCGB 2223]